MAGDCPAPARSPSCTASRGLKRPRWPSPLPRGPLLASGLPKASSHTRMPPLPPPPRSSRPYTKSATLFSRNGAQPGVPQQPRLLRASVHAPPLAPPAQHAGNLSGSALVGVAVVRAEPRGGAEAERPWERAQDEGRRRDCQSPLTQRCLWW